MEENEQPQEIIEVEEAADDGIDWYDFPTAYL